jgi:hypothetical protein
MVLLLAVLCSSCGDDELNLSCELTDLQTALEIDCELSRDLSYTRKQIKGTWTWVQRPVYLRNQPYYYATPKNTGYAMSINFDGEFAHQYHCDSLIETKKYRIQKWGDVSNVNENERNYTVIAYYDKSTNDFIEAVPTRICKSRLNIENYPNSGADTYIKN